MEIFSHNGRNNYLRAFNQPKIKPSEVNDMGVIYDEKVG
jgi:hypothetical protein